MALAKHKGKCGFGRSKVVEDFCGVSFVDLWPSSLLWQFWQCLTIQANWLQGNH